MAGLSVKFSGDEFCFVCGKAVLGADAFSNPTSFGTFSLNAVGAGCEKPLSGLSVEEGVRVCSEIGSWPEPSGPIDSAIEPCWMGLGMDLDVEV